MTPTSRLSSRRQQAPIDASVPAGVVRLAVTPQRHTPSWCSLVAQIGIKGASQHGAGIQWGHPFRISGDADIVRASQLQRAIERINRNADFSRPTFI